MPGAVITGMFGIWRGDLIGWIVVSYYMSYAVVGFLALLTVAVPYRLRGVVLFGALLLLGFVGVYQVLSRRSPSEERAILLRPLLNWRYDGLLLALLIGYHIALLLTLYPDLGYAAASDWGRHFAAAAVMWRAPYLYAGSYPPFLRAHLSTVLGLTNASVGAIAFALVLAGSIYPLTLYFMGRELFPAEGCWKPAPVLLAIIGEFIVRSGGLSWIMRIGGGEVFPKGYWFQSGIFYGTQHIAVALLAFTLGMIFSESYWKNGPHIRNIIASLWISSLYLTHIVEAFVLGISVALYHLLVESEHLKALFRKINISILTGFLVSSAALLWLKAWLPLFDVGLSHLLSSITPAILASASIGLERFETARRTLKAMSRLVKTVVVKRSSLVVTSLLFVYTACLVTWVDLRGEEVVSVRVAGQIIPFYEIPIILGIPGVLSLLGYYAATTRGKEFPAMSRTLVYFSLGSSLVALLTGAALSLGMVTGISGRLIPEIRLTRIGKFLLLPAATSGLIFLFRGITGLAAKKPGHARISKKVAVSIVILVLLVSFEAIPAVMGSLVYKKLDMKERRDVEAMSFLSEVLREDRNAYAISTTLDVSYELSLAEAPFRQVPRETVIEVLDQRAPEGAILMGFKGEPAGHPYLVEPTNSPKQLFYSRLVSKLEPIYSDSSVRIYNLSKLYPIPKESRVVLAMPSSVRLSRESLSDLLVAYLSMNSVNFTTSIDLDPMILESKALILPYDPPPSNFLNESLSAHLGQIQRWAPSWGVSFDVGKLVGRKVVLGPKTVRASAALSPLPPTREATINLTLIPQRELLVADAVFGIIYSSQRAGDSSHAALVVLSRGGQLYAGLMTASEGGGLQTSISRVGSWEVSQPISVELILDSNRVKLLVNGKSVSISRAAPLGRIGVIWTSSLGSAFDLEISISQRSFIQWGPYLKPDSLDRYVRSGGTLVVINGNGYFHYSRELLGEVITDKCDLASQIVGPVEIPLHREVLVQSFEGELGRSCEVMMSYVTTSGELVPFLCGRPEGEGYVYLLNVRPIISDLDESKITNEDFEEISRIIVLPLRSIGLIERLSEDAAEGYPGRNVVGGFWANEAILKFSSAILEIEDNSTVSLLARGSGIEVQGPGFVGVWCSEPIAARFSGLNLSITWEKPLISSFYATVDLSRQPTLNLAFPDNAHVLVWKNGSLRELDLPPGNYSLEILGGDGWESTLYVRTPQIFSEGLAEFLSPFHLDFVPHKAADILDRAVLLNGTLSFEVDVADGWLILDRLAFDGCWEIRPALFKIDWRTAIRSFGKAVLIILPLTVSIAALGCHLSPALEEPLRKRW